MWAWTSEYVAVRIKSNYSQQLLMSKSLVRKGLLFVQNSCLVAVSLRSEPGRRHERVRAGNKVPRQGGGGVTKAAAKKQRTHSSQQSLKEVLSRDKRKPAMSEGAKETCIFWLHHQCTIYGLYRYTSRNSCVVALV